MKADRDWSAEIQSALGPAEEHSLDDVLGALNSLSKTGNVEAAYSLASDLLAQASEAGSNDSAEAILDSIEPYASALSARQQGWLRNYRALVLMHAGKQAKAADALKEAWRLASRSADQSLQSNVALNLGAAAHGEGDDKGARRWYRIALKRALGIEDYEVSTKLMLNLASLAVEHGRKVEANELLANLESILAVVPNKSLRSTLHGILGRAAVEQRDLVRAESEFRKSAALAKRSGKLLGYATGLQNLGMARLENGKPGLALRSLREALDVCERVNARKLQLTVLQSMALAFVRAKRYEEAASALESLRHLALELDDRAVWARSTMDLGAVEAETRDFESASEHIREAISAGVLSDRDWQHQAAQNLIAVGSMASDPDLVRTNLDFVLNALPANDHEGRTDSIQLAAKSLSALGWPVDEVENLLIAGLVERKAARDSLAYARDSTQAGAIVRDRGQLAAASRFFTLALNIYQRRDERELAFHVRNDRALVWVQMGRVRRARSELAKCLQQARKLKNRRMELQSRSNLGEVERQLGKLGSARAHTDAAISLARELRDDTEMTRLRGNRALIAFDEREFKLAERLYREQLELATTQKDRTGEAAALGGLAGLAFSKRDFREAARLYEQAVRRATPVDHDDQRHLAEDMAGALESYALTGNEKKTQRIAQELVNLSQQAHFESLAAGALGQAALEFLRRGARDNAGALYFASIAVVASDPGGDEAVVKALFQQVARAVTRIEMEEGLVDREILYQAIVDRFRESSEEVAESVASLIPTAVSAARAVIKRSERAHPSRRKWS